jgi:hypothetical protein
MCDDELNRAALARAGTPCYVDLPEEVKPVIVTPAPVVEEKEAAPALGKVDNSFDWSQLGG